LSAEDYYKIFKRSQSFTLEGDDDDQNENEEETAAADDDMEGKVKSGIAER